MGISMLSKYLQKRWGTHPIDSTSFPEFVLQEMQRQLDEFNRSVTIVIWYKVGHRLAICIGRILALSRPIKDLRLGLSQFLS